ncbi:hypothetical protein [Ectothiorhodospira mobilis]|uniref:hypothetical protein n=1 Tax=Ectothiorhodospira mobilis TaxID=195064 RepID=UPI00190739D6|nr:hypothetical protein [Ectothiorhodospira mobilis]MBK1690997.1 hypothetical protein [Ectothiorhodospira mobilis]
MRIKCPACHGEFNLEAALDDAAGRELMAVLADMPAEASRPLVAYLGLWRSKTRALSWDRALRLTREVLALDGDYLRLAAALAETVEAIRGKRERGEDTRALRSHQYLMRVLEGTPAGGGRAAAQAPAPAQGGGAAPAGGGQPSRSMAGLAALNQVREYYDE